MSRWLEIATAEGNMSVYEALPARPDGRTVVVLMEAFGLTDHIREICERFATAGWRALAPDLYHRTAPRRTFDEQSIDQAMQHYAAMTAETVLADWDALAGELTGKAALTGFCMGGRWAFVVACERSAQLIAASSFYGAGIERELARCDRLQVPLRLVYGADDPLIPAAAREQTEAALTVAAVEYQVSVYPAGHGFMCAQRSAYAPRAAASAWDETLAFMNGLASVNEKAH